MDDERNCDESAFQTVWAATWKLHRLSCVLVEGTSMSWRSAELRFARPEMPATDEDVAEVGMTVLTDTVKRRDCYLELYSLWHWEPMKHVVKSTSIYVMLSYLPTPTTRRAAAFRTI